jgi:hypothetical protein
MLLVLVVEAELRVQQDHRDLKVLQAQLVLKVFKVHKAFKALQDRQVHKEQ